MRRNLLIPAAAATLLLAGAVGYKLFAHCQIPCGIYDDPMRFSMLREHVTTIEKSMNQIMELGAAEKTNWNQIVRWVNNKDEHADELSHIVTFYFLAQRIKPVDPGKANDYKKYLHQLELLHHMVVYSMKAKQTVDLENVKKLRALIDEFEASYLGK